MEVPLSNDAVIMPSKVNTSVSVPPTPDTVTIALSLGPNPTDAQHRADVSETHVLVRQPDAPIRADTEVSCAPKRSPQTSTVVIEDKARFPVPTELTAGATKDEQH